MNKSFYPNQLPDESSAGFVFRVVRWVLVWFFNSWGIVLLQFFTFSAIKRVVEQWKQSNYQEAILFLIYVLVIETLPFAIPYFIKRSGSKVTIRVGVLYGLALSFFMVMFISSIVFLE